MNPINCSGDGANEIRIKPSCRHIGHFIKVLGKYDKKNYILLSEIVSMKLRRLLKILQVLQ